jgi:hypothetical protein
LALIAGCGGGPSEDDDAGIDAGSMEIDAGKLPDAGNTDPDAGGTGDAGGNTNDGGSDGGNTGDAGSLECAAMDVEEGEPCGPTERPGTQAYWDGSSCVETHWCRCVGPDCEDRFMSVAMCETAYAACLARECLTDSDCESGAEWCEGGRCVECDNSGTVCLIRCAPGTSTYMRNGCSPCECAPENECEGDRGCGGLNTCYQGAFCWDWCPPGDPSCCFGNFCSASGCPEPAPVGCVVRGCPRGESCVVEGSCVTSGCVCMDDGWACQDDCGGGVCVADS